MAESRPGWPTWIATCGRTGYVQVAPGTAGSTVGLALVAALGRVPLSRGRFALLAAVALSIFSVGVWAAGRAERFFGRTDPSQVVIDEVVGQMIPFLARPDAGWKWLLTGFALFRVLDVVKPFPARRAERIPAGWGIMLDDIIAGAYSLALMSILGFAMR